MSLPPPDPSRRSAGPVGPEQATRAAQLGVATSYLDDRGRPVDVDPAIVAAVVAALDAQVVTTGPLPPVVVAWDGAMPAVPVTGSPHDVRAVCVTEGGERRPMQWNGSALHLSARAVPLGEHRILATVDGREAEAVVLAPPTSLDVPPRRGGGRHWGWFAPLYALRTRRHDAVSDLTDLAALFDWVGAHGGNTVLTLPLLAGFSDGPVEPSPYAPTSRRFWNELIVDVHRLPDGPPPPAAPSALDAAGLIDYDVVAHHRHESLAAAATAWLRRGGDRDEAFVRWISDHPLAPAYARFRAVAARHGRDWRRWPERLRAGDPAALQADDGVPGVERLHLYAQYVADAQMAELAGRVRAEGRLLGLDLAVGCHADGFDVWHDQSLFVPGMSVGAPPDSFWTGGQDWGFPPLHPMVSRADAHRYVRESLRHQLRHAGLLRLDHVMGLYRLWWVPQGGRPDEGTYVQYPVEELVAVALLEAWRAGAFVVGENLGTVPPEVESLMERHNLLGTSVAQERGEDGVLPAPVRSLATVNTHDTPTFAGWVHSRDTDDRLALGLIDEETAAQWRARRGEVVAAWREAMALQEAAGDADLLRGVLERLVSGPAAVVVGSVEDLWLEQRPQNTPGTWRERPNWRRPFTVGLDELDGRADAAATLLKLARVSSVARAEAPPVGS
jgi:4-alpha-glucanotransferase